MVEILISSSVLIIIICGIRILWKGKINLHLQYTLWLLVVIRLLPIWLFLDVNLLKIESPISIIGSYHNIYSFIHSDTNKISQRDLSINETTSNSINDSSPNSLLANKTNLDTSSQNSIQLNPSLDDTFDSIPIKIITKVIWYIGMLLSTLWILYVNIRLQSTIKRDRKLLDNINCKLTVYESSSIHSPMLLMVHGRYGIYVTKSCTMDDSTMRHAITHELCHYKHRDHLWSLIRCCIVIIYWFNPLVWLAAILSKRDCELSCDASVLKILGDEERFSYGRTILKFIEVRNKRSNIINIATRLSESNSGIKERILQITKKSRMMFSTCISILIIIVLGIIVTFTNSPKEARGDSNKKGINSNAESTQLASVEDHNTDLSKLLDEENSINDSDSGYYYNGEHFITPDGPIKSLSEFTDQIIVNKYFGKASWGEVDRALKHGYTKSFSKLEGISYWITIDVTEDSSLTIDYSTTATKTTLKTLVILPNKTTVKLKNRKNTIMLTKGKSEIAIVAYDATGKVNVTFSGLSDTVSINKSN